MALSLEIHIHLQPASMFGNSLLCALRPSVGLCLHVQLPFKIYSQHIAVYSRAETRCTNGPSRIHLTVEFMYIGVLPSRSQIKCIKQAHVAFSKH